MQMMPERRPESHESTYSAASTLLNAPNDVHVKSVVQQPVGNGMNALAACNEVNVSD
jgi:hypothetical protein